MNKYSQLALSEITVETLRGNLLGIVSESSRGKGNRKYYLSLWLLTKEQPPAKEQCYVTFNNQKYGATFNDIVQANGAFKSRLDTIINDGNFWA